MTVLPEGALQTSARNVWHVAFLAYGRGRGASASTTRPRWFAKDGGRRALGGDTVSDRSHRGPSVHRRPPGVPTIARGARQRQARLFWPPRLSAGRYGPILERRASASGNAPPGAPEGDVQYRAGWLSAHGRPDRKFSGADAVAVGTLRARFERATWLFLKGLLSCMFESSRVSSG